jgi:hypothetical protein
MPVSAKGKKVAPLEPARGELIALDGLADAKLQSAAKKLLHRSAHGAGISTWDASGLFFQLDASTCPDVPSPKTLLILYAADLEFRLRWEIEPCLAEGKDVVAAPYIQTAIAFGRATGVEAAWMEKLFSFAPRATQSYGVPGAGVKAKGFPSHCFEILTKSSKHWKDVSTKNRAAKHLVKLKAVPKASKKSR